MLIKEINIKNKIIIDKYEMANKLHKYFSNIGWLIAIKIMYVDVDHLEFIHIFSGDSMFVMPTDELEIMWITGNLLCTKSLHYYEIVLGIQCL